MRRRGLPALVLAGAAAAGLLAGCSGGGSSVVVHNGATTSPAPSTSAPPGTAAGPTTTGGGQGQQQLTVTPSTGLASSQVVHLAASGFSPHQALVVTECADKGENTGPGDCNLPGMLNTTSDAGGRVAVDFRVVKGPYGDNRIVCGSPQRCLVSVSQATLSPTEEADAPIGFK